VPLHFPPFPYIFVAVYAARLKVTFLPQNISVVLQLAAAGTHLYEQRKRENADRCLPALGTPPDAKPCMEHAGSRGEFKLWEGS
jgi:hypothetical protein